MNQKKEVSRNEMLSALGWLEKRGFTFDKPKECKNLQGNPRMCRKFNAAAAAAAAEQNSNHDDSQEKEEEDKVDEES